MVTGSEAGPGGWLSVRDCMRSETIHGPVLGLFRGQAEVGRSGGNACGGGVRRGGCRCFIRLERRQLLRYPRISQDFGGRIYRSIQSRGPDFIDLVAPTFRVRTGIKSVASYHSAMAILLRKDGRAIEPPGYSRTGCCILPQVGKPNGSGMVCNCLNPDFDEYSFLHIYSVTRSDCVASPWR